MLFNVGKWLFLLGIFTSLIDGLLPRAFALVSDNGFDSFLGPRYFLTMGFVLCLATADLRKLLIGINDQKLLLALALAMLAGSSLINDPTESLITFYHYFALLAFTPIAIISSVRQRSISIAILVCLAALAPIGLAQGITDAPLISVGQVGDKFSVIAFVIFDHIRAFSLFSSPAAFGYFLILAANVLLYKIKCSNNAQKILVYGIMMAAIFLCIYFTRTRTVYFLALISLSVTAFGSPKLSNSKRQFVLAQSFGFLLMVSVIGVAVLRLDGAEAASTSVERYANWVKIFNEYNGSPFTAKLFGLALRQTDDLVYSESLLIDNSFVSAFAGFGLTGLLFFLIAFHRMGTSLYEAVERQPNLFPYAATYSTWMAGGVSNNFFVFPILVFFLALMARERSTSFHRNIDCISLETSNPVTIR